MMESAVLGWVSQGLQHEVIAMASWCKAALGGFVAGANHALLNSRMASSGATYADNSGWQVAIYRKPFISILTKCRSVQNTRFTHAFRSNLKVRGHVEEHVLEISEVNIHTFLR
ncbi:hypothetical protein EAO30_27300 [Klebsiella pneumoniae]|nr:hypothetical protein EAO30_27300 [Klebsiella pneumoniae]